MPVKVDDVGSDELNYTANKHMIYVAIDTAGYIKVRGYRQKIDAKTLCILP